MRTKRFLLVTAALTTAAAAATGACGKNPATPEKPDGETLPLPANPKGSFYDAGVEPPPPPPETDAGTTGTPDASNPKPPPIQDAGFIKPHPLPANPKGSFYDGGRRKAGPTDKGF